MNTLLNKLNKKKLSLLLLLSLFILVFGLSTKTVDAQFGYGACDEYGPMAYESGGYCRCMSGYVMGEGLLGGSYCISEDQACKDSYGYNARASYLGGCECRSGYVFDTNMFGDKECVSADSVCKDDLGIMSRYNSLSDTCECLSGYVIDGGKCTDGDRVCRGEHGYHSSYDSLSNSCECDRGYTFDDDFQCVEKHNSAYFTLLDISEDGDELLVQSQHDFQNYIIEYGLGCWDYAIETYEGLSLVINMGTDFSVDMFDTLVLQNHDQNCSIMSVDWTSDDSFSEPEEETNYFNYIPPVNTFTPAEVVPEPAPVIPEPVVDVVEFEPVTIAEETVNEDVEVKTPNETDEIVKVSTSSDEQVYEKEVQPDEVIEKESKPGFFSRIFDLLFGWVL